MREKRRREEMRRDEIEQNRREKEIEESRAGRRERTDSGEKVNRGSKRDDGCGVITVQCNRVGYRRNDSKIIEKREDVEIEYATAILLFLSNSTHTALVILISSSYPTYTLLKPLNKHIILTPIPISLSHNYSMLSLLCPSPSIP